jgi:adenine/guanine phosphoribosyltransferase-like PRPP-binding protein
MAVGPVEGVILAKIVALAIGVGCVMAAKHRPLRVANLFFAGVVAWNLSIIARLA